MMLVEMALGQELDRGDDVGDQWPGSMQHNLHCETVVSSSSVELVEQINNSPPQMHFHLDLQVVI